MHDVRIVGRRTVLRGLVLVAGAAAMAPVLDVGSAWASQPGAVGAPFGTITAIARGSTGLIGISRAAGGGGHDVITMAEDGRTAVERMRGVPASAVIAAVAVSSDGWMYATGGEPTEQELAVVQDDEGRPVRMTTVHSRSLVWSRRPGAHSWLPEYESPAERSEHLTSIATSDDGAVLAVGVEVDAEGAVLSSFSVRRTSAGWVRTAVSVPTAGEGGLSAVNWWGGAWAGAAAAVTGSALWRSSDGVRWQEVGQPDGWDGLAVRVLTTIEHSLVAAGNSLVSGAPVVSRIPRSGRPSSVVTSSGREPVESLARGRGGAALLLRRGEYTIITEGAGHGAH